MERQSQWVEYSKKSPARLGFAFLRQNYLSAISFFGSIAAQEVIKITGKFTPLGGMLIHEFYTQLFKSQEFETIAKDRKEI